MKCPAAAGVCTTVSPGPHTESRCGVRSRCRTDHAPPRVPACTASQGGLLLCEVSRASGLSAPLRTSSIGIYSSSIGSSYLLDYWHPSVAGDALPPGDRPTAPGRVERRSRVCQRLLVLAVTRWRSRPPPFAEAPHRPSSPTRKNRKFRTDKFDM